MSVERLIVLPPEFDGATVYVDDAGGGHTVLAHVGEFPEATARVDLQIGSNCTDAYSYVRVDMDGYRPYTRHGVLIRAGIDRQIRVGVAPDPSRQGDTILPALEPLVQIAPRALVGPLRVVHHPASKTHSYADDTGPRRVLFCSWFCALRDWRNDPVKAATVLDRVVLAGYQGVRMYRVLGESDSSGYYAGRATLKDWAIPVLLEFLKACEDRKLRVQLSCGQQWGTVERLAWERQCLAAIQAAGRAGVIALYEGDNEPHRNAPMRDSDEQYAFYRDLFAMVRSTLRPTPFCACGAPANEDPTNLYRAAQHSDVLEKHGMRDEDRCVKRGFTPWYWEGDPGHFGMPMWEGEPVPPPAPDASFMPTNSPGRLVATLAINQLVGNAVTFFSGQAVRNFAQHRPYGETWMPPFLELWDTPAFDAVPKLLAYLPEDVAKATHVTGGNIWWWQLSDGRFATVADGDYWGPSALAPPRPVKSYQVIGPGWTVREGTGAPMLQPTDGAALIIGEFA